MSTVSDDNALMERARALKTHDLNGMRLAFVTLEPAGNPTHAWLDVEFINDLHLTPVPTPVDFTVSGGSRILAGPAAGQVHVSDVQAGNSDNTLRIKIEPVGDYSTYRLLCRLQFVDGGGKVQPALDPLFAELPFKFRPGCFNVNCAPDQGGGKPRETVPVIDYLARDYDSFKHVILNAMALRVPDWAPSSEADLDQVLIDLIAADADELADYQDRVANEAYLASARKRVSLARHARLMDYHIHQGQQAGTWIAVIAAANRAATATPRFGVWNGPNWSARGAVVFAAPGPVRWQTGLNQLLLYDWSGTVAALDAGATEADLTNATPMNEARANALLALLMQPAVERLLLQQERNPETGTVNGRDIHARQLLELLPLNTPGLPARAEKLRDPVTGDWLVRLRWTQASALKRRYCFSAKCAGADVKNLCLFYGNLVWVTHGRPRRTTFVAKGLDTAPLDEQTFVATDGAHYEVTPVRRQTAAPSQSLGGPALTDPGPRWGTLCPLPTGPLAYRQTPPGGERATLSTVSAAVSSFATPWTEVIDFIDSDDNDIHFIVETDENGRSSVRFGNGINGRALPNGATVTLDYQVGLGSEGNVGADSLTGMDCSSSGFPDVTRVWNPFDVIGGLDPEPVEEIVRRVPEAYRRRQLRAVTLDDYARRAEELSDIVSHARASYAWTGSWRTVRVAIDPVGRIDLDATAVDRIARYLDAVRLIGEDMEIRPPDFVPLDIEIALCAGSAYWPEDLRFELDREFSDGYTADGRLGFFHPDAWTFGQSLHVSQLIGRALAVEGVERVLWVSIRRWNPGRGGATQLVQVAPEDLPKSGVDELKIGPFEILVVTNDPNRLEQGRIRFDIRGGRR